VTSFAAFAFCDRQPCREDTVKINWHRGALRLWMVAAVAWCAVVVVLNWNKMEVAATSETVHIKFSDTETWNYPVAWGVERIEADLESRVDALNKAEEEWFAGVPETRKAECRAIPPKTLFSDMPKDCVRMFFVRQGDKLAVPNGWQAEVRNASAPSGQAITKLTLWALGPPLFVLALGVSLIWAFAGFKRA
jgi:hypothetical protein